MSAYLREKFALTDLDVPINVVATLSSITVPLFAVDLLADETTVKVVVENKELLPVPAPPCPIYEPDTDPLTGDGLLVL